MMVWGDQQVEATRHLSLGRSRMVESEVNRSLVRFYFSRQAETNSASVEDVLDHAREAGKQVD
jgi:hypothetical protein